MKFFLFSVLVASSLYSAVMPPHEVSFIEVKNSKIDYFADKKEDNKTASLEKPKEMKQEKVIKHTVVKKIDIKKNKISKNVKEKPIVERKLMLNLISSNKDDIDRDTSLVKNFKTILKMDNLYNSLKEEEILNILKKHPELIKGYVEKQMYDKVLDENKKLKSKIAYFEKKYEVKSNDSKKISDIDFSNIYFEKFIRMGNKKYVKLNVDNYSSNYKTGQRIRGDIYIKRISNNGVLLSNGKKTFFVSRDMVKPTKRAKQAVEELKSVSDVLNKKD